MRTDLRAHWVTRSTLVYLGVVEPGWRAALHHEVAGVPALRLEPTETLPPIVEVSARHLRGAQGLRLVDTPDDARLDAMLRGDLEVVVTGPHGRLEDRTGVQCAGVIDERYSDAAAAAPLGVHIEHGAPVLRVWAPTARRVTLLLFDTPQPAEPTDPRAGAREVTMVRNDADGVWTARGTPDWDRHYYLYDVEVVRPATGVIETNLVTDPYARSLSANSTRSQIVDLDDAALAPPGWATHGPPAPAAMLPVIYELHVRDHSACDPSIPEEHVGRFLAFTHADSHGMRHLRMLARAGLTHVQLLPVTDFATVPERQQDQLVPHIDPPDDPASEQPQAVVARSRARQAHAWGYDPLHPGVPEGSYATDPDGVARIVELRQMVQALHEAGLRVVLDVVFNHTVAAGRDPHAVLDRIVPGYYHRLSADGVLETSTCCPNLAPEHRMTGRYVVDTVVDLARTYRVDGFRFDLMGHHPRANLLAVRAALDRLTLHRDGVDGPSMLLLGEGWDFGEVAGGARFDQAVQGAMPGARIAAFDDRLRDGVRGGGPGRDPQAQGWASGLGTDPSEIDQGDAASVWRRAVLHQRWVQVGMAGGLAAMPIPTPDAGSAVWRRAEELHYGGAPAGVNRDPTEQVVSVGVHDDETLFDAIALKAPASCDIDDRVRMAHVALSVALLSQGLVVVHAGEELLRSKSLDRDSYASGDWFNQLDYTREHHGFGIGLPPAEKNGERWPLLRTILRTRPRPERRHLDATVAHLTELLAIRRGASAFTIRSGAEVLARLRFHLVGGMEQPGLIVLAIDGLGGHRDPDLLVVANARPLAVEVALPTPARAWRLHRVQQRSRDTWVRETRVSATQVVVAARTVAVLSAAGGAGAAGAAAP